MDNRVLGSRDANLPPYNSACPRLSGGQGSDNLSCPANLPYISPCASPPRKTPHQVSMDHKMTTDLPLPSGRAGPHGHANSNPDPPISYRIPLPNPSSPITGNALPDSPPCHKNPPQPLTKSLGVIPPELPPSVEGAYRKKCIQLKQRMNEVEEANDSSRQRLARINRSIQKLRLERAFLLEQLAKRTSTNVEDSEGSPSPPPTVRFPLSILSTYIDYNRQANAIASIA
jgi:hypothetical protein